MFKRYRTKAICYSLSDYKEADQRISFITKKYGKVELIGKGIRKKESKLRSGLDLFYLSEIEYIKGKNNTITNSVKLKRFDDVIESEKFNYAVKFFEKLDKISNKGDNLWKVSYYFLKSLSNNNSDLVYFYYLYKLLEYQGYSPEIYYCSCSNRVEENKVYFSSIRGGVMCDKCSEEDKIKISDDVIKILRLIQKDKLNILGKIDFIKYRKELNNIFDSYCEKII